jgi:hypothetical protein
MNVRREGVLGRLGRASRPVRPLIKVTVSPWWARVLIAAGAQRAASDDSMTMSFTPSELGGHDPSPDSRAGEWHHAGGMPLRAAALGLMSPNTRINPANLTHSRGPSPVLPRLHRARPAGVDLPGIGHVENLPSGELLFRPTSEASRRLPMILTLILTLLLEGQQPMRMVLDLSYLDNDQRRLLEDHIRSALQHYDYSMSGSSSRIQIEPSKRDDQPGAGPLPQPGTGPLPQPGNGPLPRVGNGPGYYGPPRPGPMPGEPPWVVGTRHSPSYEPGYDGPPRYRGAPGASAPEDAITEDTTIPRREK